MNYCDGGALFLYYFETSSVSGEVACSFWAVKGGKMEEQ